MKISEVITITNTMKPNQLTQSQLLYYINEIESDISINLYNVSAADYIKVTDTNLERELLSPIPYDGIYFQYLSAKIDEVNGQMDRYSVSSVQFNSTYADLSKFVLRKSLADTPDVSTVTRFTNYI